MKQEAKSTVKMLAFVMALLILIASFPVSSFANVISESINDTDADDISTNADIESNSATEGVFVLEEVENLREENVKHFKLSNGTTRAVAYAQAVHYKDADGNWVDIDNALTLNGSEYTSNNKQSIKFANKSGSNGLVSIKDGDYKIDFTPLNTNKVSVSIENPQENNSRKFEDVSKLNNLVSKATYVDIYDGIDIEYILVGNNIKENIIVNGKQDSYVYSFELKLNKLTAELLNGSIILSDSTTGEHMYVIPAPYMYDANGVMSTDVEYSLVQNNKWKYTFNVTANNEWINADGRAFPITIDPTVVADTIDTDTFVMSDNGDYWDMGALIIGNFMGEYLDSPGFMKFNTLPDIPEKSVLIKAELAMFLSYVQNTSNIDFYIGVYKATQDWIDDSDFSYTTSSQYYESTPIHSVEIQNDGAYEWDITSLYEQWKNGGENHGVCVKVVSLPSDCDANVRIAAIGNLDGNLIPQLELTYVDVRGVEDYYGYVNTSLGTVGESYVNLYNGSLTYVNNLTTIENQILPYELNMVYDSIDKVWTSSFDERIQPFDDFSDGIFRYVWTDGDGTIHNFAPYLQKNYWGAYVQYEHSFSGTLYETTNPSVFYPEDDIDYVLTINSNGEFILKDYFGNQKLFNSNGQLSKICDVQGNVLYFYYICDGDTFTVEDRLPELFLIVYKPANGEAVQQIKLWYDDGRLCYIHNIQTNREIIIEWNNELISTISYSDEEQNVDSYVDFFYDNSGRLSSIVNASDSSTSNWQNLIDYSYDNDKIDEICQYYNSQLESKHTIGYNSTVDVRDFGELIEENTDDILISYSFDDIGRKTYEVKTNYISGSITENLSFSYSDSVLPSSVYYSVVFNNNINCEPFVTITDAALMFFNEIYATSLYIRHEFGTRIYGRTYNNITTYNFTYVATGTTHSTDYINAVIPNNTTFVATAHTHPNSNTFSPTDINNTVARNVDSYMVGPNLLLNFYDVSESETNYGVMPITTSITLNEGNILVEKFIERWLEHITNGCENGFGCSENTLWPNTQDLE